MSSVVVLLSGGLDSATLAYRLTRAEGRTVVALSVDYGQRHVRELRAAGHVAERLGVEHVVVDLGSFGSAVPGSSLTDPAIDVPRGHYEDASMRATVVPNRNMVLLSVAAAVAASRGADSVAYAAHAGDHAIYPDCRPAFVDAMRGAFRVCHYSPLDILTPYVRHTKGDIVAEGARLGVPYAVTWTCYEGGVEHCGACGACTERREAFVVARVPDPTRYAGGAT